MFERPHAHELPKSKSAQLFFIIGNTPFKSFMNSNTTSKELLLYGLNIKTLPESIDNMKSLKILYLNDNYLLNSLPESISKLTSLRELNVANNQLEFLPESVGELIWLETLDLRNNHLTTLPEPLLDMDLLQEITIEGNKFNSNGERVLLQLQKNGVRGYWKQFH